MGLKQQIVSQLTTMATLNSCFLLQRAKSFFGVETAGRTFFLRKAYPARTRTRFFQFDLRRQTLYFPCQQGENQSCALLCLHSRQPSLNYVYVTFETAWRPRLWRYYRCHWWQAVISLCSKLTSTNTECGALLMAPYVKASRLCASFDYVAHVTCGYQTG